MLPFLAMVAAFVVVYKTQVNASSATYSSRVSMSRALNFINLISWTLGFHSPRHTYENWVPHWSHGQTIVQLLILATILAGLVVGWRRWRPWRIGLFVLTMFVTAVAIATVGGIPYHAFPLAIMYGFAFLLALEAIADRLGTLRATRFRWQAGYAATAALFALMAAMMYEAMAPSPG
jgi:hypothetical protein